MTTSAAPPTAEVERARIAVMVAAYQVDVVVPTKFTIETFIEDLVGVLATAIADETVDFTPPTGQWSLARPGELPIPRWRSLADHDVADGTVLALCPVESSEVFTPVVEDITDALAMINEREFAEYDADTSAVVGLAVLGVAAVLVAALLSWVWTDTGAVGWCALPALLLGGCCWGGAVAAFRNHRSGRACLALALAALPLLFAGGAMLVPTAYGAPGPFGAANIAAGGTFIVVASVSMIRLTGVGLAPLLAAAMSGLLMTAAMLPSTVATLPVHKVAGGAVLVTLILLTVAPRLAMVLAWIRPPDLPDPGTDVAPATLNDIFEAESARPDDDRDNQADEANRERAALSIERRARLAVSGLRGLIIAIATALALATVVAAAASPGGIREIIMAAAVAGILLMRARWHPDRVQAIALITASAATICGIAVVLVGAYETGLARTTVVLVLAGLAIAGCVGAMRLPDKRLSPVTRRAIDLFEYALLVVVPVIAFWIMGVYTAMRGI
ncbi:type VII secretion integral membrane protein EccD [Nocardia iowensis]|uniref:Type VII secretion integral membrane protein EccD n=1 Tax=Nocardia iowensis TaxID=204891 RepID=A0ABX8RYE3_NOCIO|nr:type VII secretion integral membrane protein EccD [Nocardia iowensis]QXN94679.1 type VII secretion integral membrane protein EccD [Nocardia iowensis]